MHVAGAPRGARRWLKRGASALPMLFLALPAWAQQQVPGSVAPGRVEQPFQPPTTPPPVAGEPIVPPGLAPAEAPPGAENVRFILKEIVIEGATAIPAASLAPLYQERLDREATLRDVYSIAAAITAQYGAAGYVLSQAVIPAQRISGGIVHIRVVEGFVATVTFKNESGAPVDDRLLRAYGDKIAAAHPLRADVLERYLLLMNDLPGVTARSYMQPSAGTAGAADMVVVIERKLYDVSASVDNRGTRFLGPYQGLLAVSLNNALGLDERTTLRGINTAPLRDLHYIEISHDEQLGSEGTKATLGGFFTDARPGSFLTGLHDRDLSAWAQLVHPFIRARGENLSVRARIEVDELNAYQSGVQISRDELRILRVQASYDVIDTLWHHPAADLITVEASQGLPIAASTTSARPGTSLSFTKVAGLASRNQPLFGDFSAFAAVSWQASGAVLPPSEEFGVGGTEFGRGYDPSELIGDSGLAGKIELRWTQELSRIWLRTYQLYAFFDAGAVWSNLHVSGAHSESTGTSTGAGARLTLDHGLSGYVELGAPLTRVVAAEGNKSPRLFFGVTGRF